MENASFFGGVVQKILILTDTCKSILNGTSKPLLDNFSNISACTELKFTPDMDRSIQGSVSKLHSHKLPITCSIDRRYLGTITFYFHTNVRT